MALGDIVQTPQFAEPPDLNRLNREFRRIFARLNSIEGRTEAAQVRDDLDVLGDISTPGISSDALTLGGAAALSTATVSVDPDVPAELAPTLTSKPDPLGVVLPIEAGSSAFHFSVFETFCGGATTSGMIGDNGWTLSGAGTVSYQTNVSLHPGVYRLDSGAGVATSLILGGSLHGGDVSYFGAVVSPVVVDADSQYRAGLIRQVQANNGETRRGSYFSFLPGSSTTWRTVTRDATSITSNVTSITPIAGAWFLLEIVQTPTTVDFYINRQRTFRHTTNLYFEDVAPAIVAQSTGAGSAQIDGDSVVLSGNVPLGQIWT